MSEFCSCKITSLSNHIAQFSLGSLRKTSSTAGQYSSCWQRTLATAFVGVFIYRTQAAIDFALPFGILNFAQCTNWHHEALQFHVFLFENIEFTKFISKPRFNRESSNWWKKTATGADACFAKKVKWHFLPLLCSILSLVQSKTLVGKTCLLIFDGAVCHMAMLLCSWNLQRVDCKGEIQEQVKQEQNNNPRTKLWHHESEKLSEFNCDWKTFLSGQWSTLMTNSTFGLSFSMRFASTNKPMPLHLLLVVNFDFKQLTESGGARWMPKQLKLCWHRKMIHSSI